MIVVADNDSVQRSTMIVAAGNDITVYCGMTRQCAMLHGTLLDICFHHHGAPAYIITHGTLFVPAATIMVLSCALSLQTATMMMLHHTLSLPLSLFGTHPSLYAHHTFHHMMSNISLFKNRFI